MLANNNKHLARQANRRQAATNTNAMIEITSFLLRHLYELMADNYDHNHGREPASVSADAANSWTLIGSRPGRHQEGAAAAAERPAGPSCARTDPSADTGGRRRQTAISNSEQESNQQIVSFLTNNQLPDLACETFLELLFICVFVAVSWIFVMIIQLHLNQAHAGQPHRQHHQAKSYYCNTRLLASLMYCNNKQAHLLAY